MSFKSVPWAIEGASTDASLARVLANIASSDSEGINLPGDFKVTQLTTPGNGVQISKGGMTVRNAQSPGESYVGAAGSSTQVTISPTSGSARSDLVVAQVIDPDFAPWQPYTQQSEILNGPYFQPVIVSGVSPSATSLADAGVTWSGYALARVDVPANTTAVTNAMITDLRQLARPRMHREIFMSNPTSGLEMNNTAGAVFPDFRPTVLVPEWATQAFVICTLSSIGWAAGPTQGYFTAVIDGTLQGANGLRANDILYDLDAAVTGGSRTTLVVGGGFNDVTSIAGQVVPLQTEARQINAATNPGYLETVDGTQVIFDVQFYERTV